jgi:CheY-like chemotaxis protein
MMQISPNDRYQSATEVRRDLRAALIELGEWEANDEDTEVEPFSQSCPFQLLVVDSVKKRITALTEYFAKYNFDVTYVAHPDVALERIKGGQPPNGLLILADQFTEETLKNYPQVQGYARSKKIPCLAVFPRNDRERVERAIRSTKYGATAFQPATLRDIRKHFEDVAAR